MQVNLEITSTTTTNKKQTNNITYVNPIATNSVLKSFARALIGLTTNVFSGAIRIAENDVDSEGGAKIEPVLSIGDFSYDGYVYVADITYNGDGILFANAVNSYCRIVDNKLKVDVNSGTTFTGTLYASAGAEYAAKSISFQRVS